MTPFLGRKPAPRTTWFLHHAHRRFGGQCSIYKVHQRRLHMSPATTASLTDPGDQHRRAEPTLDGQPVCSARPPRASSRHGATLGRLGRWSAARPTHSLVRRRAAGTRQRRPSTRPTPRVQEWPAGRVHQRHRLQRHWASLKYQEDQLVAERRAPSSTWTTTGDLLILDATPAARRC
jgi:hypothetical protein